MNESGIKQGISVVIFHLADTTSAVDEDFFEAAVLRAIGIGKPEVPLSEDAGAVPVFLEDIGKGHFIAMHNGSAGNCGSARPKGRWRPKHIGSAKAWRGHWPGS